MFEGNRKHLKAFNIKITESWKLIARYQKMRRKKKTLRSKKAEIKRLKVSQVIP